MTRGLHVGFRARDRAQVDAFWQAGVEAGYRDDGAPGPRTQYGPSYYGGFLLDPDGNGVEAVHSDREDAVPDGRVDHLWLRVRDPPASRRFYTTIAPHVGLRLAHDEPGRVQLSGPDYSFSLVRDGRPLTEYVHLAFPAREDAAVRAFHAAALAAGYQDHGTRASARSTTRATTARSCSTRTGTTSRSSTTTGAEPGRRVPPPHVGWPRGARSSSIPGAITTSGGTRGGRLRLVERGRARGLPCARVHVKGSGEGSGGSRARPVHHDHRIDGAGYRPYQIGLNSVMAGHRRGKSHCAVG